MESMLNSVYELEKRCDALYSKICRGLDIKNKRRNLSIS